MPIHVVFRGKSLFTIRAVVHLSIFTMTVEPINQIRKICGSIRKICGSIRIFCGSDFPSTRNFHQLNFPRNFQKAVCVDEIDRSPLRYELLILFRLLPDPESFLGNPKTISRIFKKLINPEKSF
jgi:hypothetical protein